LGLGRLAGNRFSRRAVLYLVVHGRACWPRFFGRTVGGVAGHAGARSAHLRHHRHGGALGLGDRRAPHHDVPPAGNNRRSLAHHRGADCGYRIGASDAGNLRLFLRDLAIPPARRNHPQRRRCGLAARAHGAPHDAAGRAHSAGPHDNRAFSHGVSARVRNPGGRAQRGEGLRRDRPGRRGARARARRLARRSGDSPLWRHYIAADHDRQRGGRDLRQSGGGGACGRSVAGATPRHRPARGSARAAPLRGRAGIAEKRIDRRVAGSNNARRRLKSDRSAVASDWNSRNGAEAQMRRRFVPARTLTAVVLGLLGIAVAASTMRAEDWPTRPVRLLIPFTAGGAADMLGRLAAGKLSLPPGQQFLPGNKPGARGLLASPDAANAAPDGYPLFVSGAGGLIISSAISANPPADVVTGYTHIADFGGPPAALVVNKDIPAHNLAEFIAYAKANPGKLNYGSPSP